MAVYVVTGKLGAGKTLAMVGRMRDYLWQDKPVATNIDLDVHRLLGRKPRVPIYRLPDRPTVADLQAIGTVHHSGREEKNGALVLDECGTWLNSRTWADGNRQAVIDWMLHSRKKGWDVYLIVQNLQLLDKQIRDALAEYVVKCRRLDRLRIPVIGRLLDALTLGKVAGRLPQVHMASVSYGHGPGALPADTWWYRGRDLFDCYSTVQVIGDDSPGVHCAWVPPTAAELAELERVRRMRRKLPAVAALQALPPDARVRAWRDLAAAGVL